MESELLNYIIDPDDGDTSLHIAALTGDSCQMSEILNKPEGKELINARVRPFGSTPLRLACSAGNVACVQELLKHNTNIDLADIKAQTPLFVAVYNNHIECCNVLLKAGANPNGDCRNIITPLHIACRNGSAPLVQLLLQFGSSMYGTFAHPLHVAATSGHLNCFILLLLHGAETNLPEYAVHQPSLVQVLMTNKLCSPVFLELWVLFGGSLWGKEFSSKQMLMDVETNPVIELVHNLKLLVIHLVTKVGCCHGSAARWCLPNVTKVVLVDGNGR